MSRKLVFIIVLALLFGPSGVALKVEKVKSSGTIYIRANGLIDPATVNITSADNVTYTFKDNNYGSLVIERRHRG